MNPTATDTIARNLTEAMDEAGVSVRKLAALVREKMGPEAPTYGTYQAYRQGTVQRPRLDVLGAAAEVLGVRAEWLIWGHGPRTYEEAYADRVYRTGSGASGPELDGLAHEHYRTEIWPRVERIAVEAIPRMAKASDRTWRRIADAVREWIVGTECHRR